jgi:hypothetical protein
MAGAMLLPLHLKAVHTCRCNEPLSSNKLVNPLLVVQALTAVNLAALDDFPDLEMLADAGMHTSDTLYGQCPVT